jgi:hypothetical protein
LLESLTSSAAADHLEIQEQSFGANTSTQNYQSVAVRLKLSGSLQDVIKMAGSDSATGTVPGCDEFFFEKRE